jgi:hypothetical protein
MINPSASSHGEESEAREKLRYFLEAIISHRCILQIEHPEHLHTVIDKECPKSSRDSQRSKPR